MPNKQKISWTAPEFRYYEKGVSWYVTYFVIMLLVIGYFVFTKDYFPAAAFLIMGTILLFFSWQTPRVVEITLDDKGIKWGSLIYPYKNLKYFWVVNNEKHTTLNVETTTYFNHHLVLELEDQEPNAVRNFLLNFLPEHTTNQETLAQRVSHKFKF